MEMEYFKSLETKLFKFKCWKTKMRFKPYIYLKVNLILINSRQLRHLLPFYTDTITVYPNNQCAHVMTNPNIVTHSIH